MRCKRWAWALLLTGALSLPQAALPGNEVQAAERMPLSTIVKQLEDAGYTQVRMIERESDDRYEVEGRMAHGQKFEVKVDPYTGEISGEDEDVQPASTLIKKLEDAGFANIHKLETEWFDRYEVKGEKANGSDFEAVVDQKTGEIEEDE